MVDEAVNKRIQEHERREGVTEKREGHSGTPQSEPGIGPLPEVGKERRTDSSRHCPSVQPGQADWSTPSRL